MTVFDEKISEFLLKARNRVRILGTICAERLQSGESYARPRAEALLLLEGIELFTTNNGLSLEDKLYAYHRLVPMAGADDTALYAKQGVSLNLSDGEYLIDFYLGVNNYFIVTNKQTLSAALPPDNAGGGAGVNFINPNPTPATVGQIPSGTTFADPGVSFPQFADMLLYALVANLAAAVSPRRLGSSTAVTLTYSATPKSAPITSIIVNGAAVTLSNGGVGVQAGVVAAAATQNVDTTFSMAVTAGGSTLNRSASVVWLNDRFWGSLNLTGAGVAATAIGDFVTSPPTTAQVQALASELSGTRAQVRNGINGAGNYLAFAWATRLGTPAFKVNGLTNTAFTKVWAGVNFLNLSGYTETYDLWLSNTRYNSAADQFEIT